jgi:hypothetical protein
MREARHLGFQGAPGTPEEFGWDWQQALAAVNAGKPEAWLRAVLARHGTRYGRVLARDGQGVADGYVWELYRRAEQYAQANPPIRTRNDATGELAAFRDKVEILPRWHGRTGTIDLKVLLALADIGVRAGSTIISASDRQLAELVGQTRKAVGHALGRLASDGWLKQTAKGQGTRASTYRLLLKRADSDGQSPNDPTRTSPSGGRLSGVDRLVALPEVFRPPDGLGQTAHRLWQLLGDEGVSARWLAATTGLHVSTIHEAMLRLFSAGLALGTEGAWTRYDDDLDVLAKAIGLGGHLERQRGGHQRERKGYRRWVAAERPEGANVRSPAAWLRYHRRHDLLGAARNATLDPSTPALRGTQPPARPRPLRLARPAAPLHHRSRAERVAVCVSCGHEAVAQQRSDGLALCPKCRRAMAFDADGWRRHASEGKPMPATLRRTA